MFKVKLLGLKIKPVRLTLRFLSMYVFDYQWSDRVNGSAYKLYAHNVTVTNLCYLFT